RETGPPGDWAAGAPGTYRTVAWRQYRHLVTCPDERSAPPLEERVVLRPKESGLAPGRRRTGPVGGR
ncbi:MAG: hypothetical protein M0Z42_22925, partial [Actinomycetota bacterium]|nr:hypothetical protein [Actinomycetota bacterium]